jgi:hypothetical protein
MCNLYSITTNQAAIAGLFRVLNRYVGNLPPMPGVLPTFLTALFTAEADRPVFFDSYRTSYFCPPATRAAAAPLTQHLEAAADQAIAACGGEAVKALIVVNDFLEAQLEEVRSKI